jgi:hypothetical protein
MSRVNHSEVPEYDVFVPTDEQRFRALEIVLDEVAADWQLMTSLELMKELAKLKLEFTHGRDVWPRYQYDA